MGSRNLRKIKASESSNGAFSIIFCELPTAGNGRIVRLGEAVIVVAKTPGRKCRFNDAALEESPHNLGHRARQHVSIKPITVTYSDPLG